jgi:hypothetical protein
VRLTTLAFMIHEFCAMYAVVPRTREAPLTHFSCQCMSDSMLSA